MHQNKDQVWKRIKTMTHSQMVAILSTIDLESPLPRNEKIRHLSSFEPNDLRLMLFEEYNYSSYNLEWLEKPPEIFRVFYLRDEIKERGFDPSLIPYDLSWEDSGLRFPNDYIFVSDVVTDRYHDCYYQCDFGTQYWQDHIREAGSPYADKYMRGMEAGDAVADHKGLIYLYVSPGWIFIGDKKRVISI